MDVDLGDDAGLLLARRDHPLEGALDGIARLIGADRHRGRRAERGPCDGRAQREAGHDDSGAGRELPPAAEHVQWPALVEEDLDPDEEATEQGDRDEGFHSRQTLCRDRDAASAVGQRSLR